MRYELSLAGFFAALIGPPFVLGVVGGLLARRRPFLRAVTAWLIGLCAIWSVYYLVSPSPVFAEVWQFRASILVVIFCASTIGIGAVVWLSRPRPTRPAA
jgi:hypothetical protein